MSKNYIIHSSFLAKQMNCSYPWSNKPSNIRTCETHKESIAFEEIYDEISQADEETIFRKTGCLPSKTFMT